MGVSGDKDSQYLESYQITTDFLISAVGQLNMPRWPSFPGLEDFAGKLMHSARWDWSYDFSGKRVAVVGNGNPLAPTKWQGTRRILKHEQEQQLVRSSPTSPPPSRNSPSTKEPRIGSLHAATNPSLPFSDFFSHAFPRCDGSNAPFKCNTASSHTSLSRTATV